MAHADGWCRDRPFGRATSQQQRRRARLELLADRALERWSVLVAVSLLHDEWSQARWPGCSGMEGRLRGHVARRRRRHYRRWQHVTTLRHAGEELTSSPCSNPRATCVRHTVRGRRSSAVLGRLSRLRCTAQPAPPWPRAENINLCITVIVMVLQSQIFTSAPPVAHPDRAWSLAWSGVALGVTL